MWIVKGEGMISQSVSKWMRGLAILMVIASHYAGWMFVEPVNPELREWVMTLGVFGVDIFFAMSGYGLVKAASKHGIDKRYVWNRVKTSYIPYILLIGTIMLLDSDFEDMDDVISFLTGQEYWFMAVLFIVYILFMVCWKFRILKEITFAAALIWYTNRLFVDGKASFWIVSNMTFLVGVIFADVEMFVNRIVDKKETRSNDSGKNAINLDNTVLYRIFKMILLFVGFLGMRYCYKQFLIVDTIAWEIATSIFFAITIMAISMVIPQKCSWLVPCKLLSILGSYSLFIYLLHTRVYYFIIFKLEDLGYTWKVVIVGMITITAGCVIGKLYNLLIAKAEMLLTTRLVRMRGE